MKINRIKISNILGVEHLEFEAGKFNQITGANGSGKTSLLEALKCIIKGGEDATLLRRGAEKGEIVLVLDDGTEIKKRLTQNTQVTQVTREGVKVSPAAAIKAMTDMVSVNPVEFLTVPKKQRVSVLLDSLDITADMKRLSTFAGRELKSTGQHALLLIQAVHQEIYDHRTGTNRAIREKQATINQLAATLPDGAIEQPADMKAMMAALAEIDGRKDTELTRISTKLTALGEEWDARREGIRAAAAKEVAGIEAEIQALKQKQDDIRVRATGEITAGAAAHAEIAARAAQQRERTINSNSEERGAVVAEIAKAQEQHSQAGRVAQTRETIATMRAEGEALEGDAARMTEALNGLEEYKSELLSALPIDGLSVVDGEIYRHGIPFDRLNTEQQVSIAVEIAKMRAGDLGFICVDGLESMDAAHFDAFRKASLKSDLQFFITRVTDGDFKVMSEG